MRWCSVNRVKRGSSGSSPSAMAKTFVNSGECDELEACEHGHAARELRVERQLRLADLDRREHQPAAGQAADDTAGQCPASGTASAGRTAAGSAGAASRRASCAGAADATRPSRLQGRRHLADATAAASVALTTISLANSIPVVRRSSALEGASCGNRASPQWKSRDRRAEEQPADARRAPDCRSSGAATASRPGRMPAAEAVAHHERRRRRAAARRTARDREKS